MTRLDAKDQRVIVLAPTARDGRVAAGLLSDSGIAAGVSTNLAHAIGEVRRGAGAFLLPEEALTTDGRTRVSQLVGSQPPWSDLPLLVLTYTGANSLAARDATKTLGNVTLLERPLRAGTLVSAVRTALRARERQYQIRDHLAERARVEAALRESEERQAFLLKLTDALRPLAASSEVQTVAARALGEHLGAGKVQFWEAEPDGQHLVSAGGYAPGPPNVARRARMDDFHIHLRQALTAGQPFAIADAAADPDVSATELAVCQAFGLRAYVAVPLVRSGRLVAALGLCRTDAHEWTPAEIALAGETAQRTWAAVERLRAEEALADAEARFRGELEDRVRERTAALATANTALEREVHERRLAEQQVKGLYERLVSAEEEERRRMAREIHDHLGQQMTALRLRLETLVTWLDRDPLQGEEARRTQRLAEELDQSIDFLTWQLRPAALDHLGLPATLHNHVTSWSERFGIAAEMMAVNTDGLRLAPDVETNLYRLAQEALHNIGKHAHASHVFVLLLHRNGELVLVVEDDGDGFDLSRAQQDPTSGLGLVSMRERATLVGGALQIETSPGQGTTVAVKVPVPAQPDDPARTAK